MNKISKGLLIISLMLISTMFFLYASYNFSYSPLNGENIIIKNAQNYPSDVYINKLTSLSEKYDVYPLYIERDVEQGEKSINAYYTDYDGRLPSEYPGIYNSTTRNTFDKIEKFSLEEIQVALLGESEQNIEYINALKDAGFQVETNVKFNNITFFKGFNISMIVVLMLFNALAIILYVIQCKKKYSILKIEGFSEFEVVNLELKKYKIYTIVLVSAIIIEVLVSAVLWSGDFALYLLRFQPITIIIYALFICFTRWVATFYYKIINVMNVKNGVVNSIFVIPLILLVILISFMILNVVGEFMDAIDGYGESKKNYEEVSELYGYSTVPIYTDIADAAYIGDSTSRDEALYRFYIETQNELNGTIMSIFDYDEKHKAVNINTNYLKFNKIYDENGKVLESNNFGVTAKLVPLKYKGKVNGDNIIYIKDNQELKYIKNSSGEIKTINDYMYIDVANFSTLEELSDYPDIYALDNMIISPMTMQNYYIKTDKNNPNGVTKKYIEKAQADNYIRQTPLIGNDILINLIYLKNKIITYAIMVVAWIVMWLILIVNMIKLYLTVNKKRYSLMFIENNNTTKGLIILNIVLMCMNAVFAIVLFKSTHEWFLFLMVILMNCIIVAVSKKTYNDVIVQGIVGNIKGDV